MNLKLSTGRIVHVRVTDASCRPSGKPLNAEEVQEIQRGIEFAMGTKVCEHRTTTQTMTDPPGPPICFHCGINTRTGEKP